MNYVASEVTEIGVWIDLGSLAHLHGEADYVMTDETAEEWAAKAEALVKGALQKKFPDAQLFVQAEFCFGKESIDLRSHGLGYDAGVELAHDLLIDHIGPLMILIGQSMDTEPG